MTNIELDTDLLSSYSGPRRADAERLAARILAAAQALAATGQGCYGTRKVFVAPLCAALGSTPASLGTMLAHLAAAGLLSLARADLVGAMDYSVVEASHLHAWGADFHFVVLTH